MDHGSVIFFKNTNVVCRVY